MGVFPRTLFLAAVLTLAACAPAQASTVVTQPLDQDDPVFVTGTPGSDTVRLSSDGGLRIEDASGVVAGAGTICTQRSATAVVCPAWHVPRLTLGAGDDNVDSSLTAIAVDGGSGQDALSFARYPGRRLRVTLGQTDFQGIEVLEGSSRSDRLYGSATAETIRGGAGDDIIDPGAGADTVDTGADDDTVWAADRDADRIDCGDGDDETTLDPFDQHLHGCEDWPAAGVPPLTDQGADDDAASEPQPAPRPAAQVSRPALAKRGTITVYSRPAADAGRTRIGARIGVPARDTRIRMTVRQGSRRVGQTEVVAGEPGQVVLNVPLDAEVKRVVAQTRHVELTALVELETPSGGIGEEYQATVIDPPPFVPGARGVRKRGGFGEQRLSGTRRTDTLRGDSGDDRLRGLGGNDQLHGGTGNDRLEGSAGNDHLDGFDGDDNVMGGAGDDLIIESRFGDDTLSGGPGNDWIVGARGTDDISGGSGDDVIFGGSGSDTIDCGEGNDTAFVNLEIERRTARNCERILDEDDIPSIRCPGEGTADGETMLGTDGADVCRGNGGNDDVEGAGGSDKLFGGDGDDRIFGRFGNDQLFGEAGDDELEGGRGDDRLSGGPGNDHLNGGYGRDRIDAGPGNDTVVARGGGSDQIDCGPGRDVVIADRSDRLTGCETVRRK